jgi:D-glutamate cyclase
VEPSAVITHMERLIRRDPAQRGLISSEPQFGPLCPGHLARAANDLARTAQRVAIVTGFFIPKGAPPSPETDGPPGAAALAAACTSLGITAQLVTDGRCRSAVEVAAREMNLPEKNVLTPGESHSDLAKWFDATTSDTRLPRLTHLISIERVGPSHTRESLQKQAATASADPQSVWDEFDRVVPESARNCSHNMRGECIDRDTAPLHLLFELAEARGGIRTIGVGDGGNEIGMGSIPWTDLMRRLNGANAARIPCRIATDWTIVSGVSNWGGLALAAATLLLRGRIDVIDGWTTRQQRQALERLVVDAPAVDGITRLQEPTVDGLPFLTYIQPWVGIRRLVELGDEA